MTRLRVERRQAKRAREESDSEDSEEESIPKVTEKKSRGCYNGWLCLFLFVAAVIWVVIVGNGLSFLGEHLEFLRKVQEGTG